MQQNNEAMSPGAFRLVRELRVWILVTLGLCLLGMVKLVVSAAFARHPDHGEFGSALIVARALQAIAACLYIPALIYLGRAAREITEFAASRRSWPLEKALAAEASLWKYVGIVIIGMPIAAVVLAIIVASFARMSGG